MKSPEILILTSRYDFATDYVVAELARRSASYLRLNSEDLTQAKVTLDPVRRHLKVDLAGQSYDVSHGSLQAVLYRRPVYLRDYGGPELSAGERFSRIQWASFVQGLMLFDTPTWMNSPAATYRAEHKAVQLAVAHDIGLRVPETRMTNAPDPSIFHNVGRVAIKGVDTVMVRDGGDETFGFTTFDSPDALPGQSWSSAPATIQSALEDKIDLRVTVIDDNVFPVAIKRNGQGLSDDWRLHKGDVTFETVSLPNEVEEHCRMMVQQLGLRFGAIDLAQCGEEYFFLEINPTGEWAWLVDAANIPLDRIIAEALLREHHDVVA